MSTTTTSTTTSSYPTFTFGTDPPASPATRGYNLNHTCLIVNDLAASRYFYGTIMGMREISRTEFSEDFSAVYFGYPSPSASASGSGEDETGQQMFERAKTSSGLLQLLHMRNSAVKRAAGGRSTFSHLGFFVPDVEKVRDRMQEFGVKILKDVGDPEMPVGEVAAAFGGNGALEDEKMVRATAAMRGGLGKVLLVADPDGNVVEILD